MDGGRAGEARLADPQGAQQIELSACVNLLLVVSNLWPPLLQYKPSRWWFEFALLYNKIFFVLLSVLLNSDERAWVLLGSLVAITVATLALVAVDKPFRGKDDQAEEAVPAKGTKLRCMLRAQVRAGHEMGSATAGELKVGETVEILETKVLQPAGTVRCRFARGWVSMRTGAGKTILQKIAAPASMFPTATRPAGTGAALGMAERIKAGVGVGGAAKPAAGAAEGAAGASGPAAGAPVRKNKMNDILAGLKKGQISTTAKSRGQWQDYKKKEGIDEELQAKAKNGSAPTHKVS